MTIRCAILGLLAALSGALSSCASETGDALLSQPVLTWQMQAAGASRTGNRVTVDLPQKGTAMVTAVIDAQAWTGKVVRAVIRSRGSDVARAEQHWLGYKFMFHCHDADAKTDVWPGARPEQGSWDWKETVAQVDLRQVAHPQLTLSLGLQETSGSVAFDLDSLVFEEGEPVYVTDADTSKCVYTERLRSRLPRRGFMSPSGPCKPDDLATIGSWGANLFRYQIVRDWHARNANADCGEYLRWVDSKIDHLLEVVLPSARKAGVDVVVDLHVAPGGRGDDCDLNMFYDRRYAETFLEAWRRIAARCRGKSGIWGYDLINEPMQDLAALPGCDLVGLQERAARLIRTIDPETPIIVESNNWDAPEAFATLRKIDLPDIIYQAHMYKPIEYTHQGVGSGTWKPRRYPDAAQGWNRDFLRRELQAVRDFQLRHDAIVYIGEFSAIAWAEGAGEYLTDCISLFEEYGWSWSYHALREWSGWSVEHVCEGPNHPFVYNPDNPRWTALRRAFRAP